MRKVRQEIGGLGNLMFKQAFLWALFRDGIIPDVYLQSSKYWEKYKDEIRQMWSYGIGRDERVALHIRRGDYLKVTQFHMNLWDTDFYKKAVKKFPKGTKFLVFCKDNQSEAQDQDDKQWCLQNLPQLGIDFELYEHGEETEDLNTMASCRGLIGANSSFSWWAAFLNPHADKKIIFPTAEKWFTDGKVRIGLLPEWIKL